jgi:glycerophosphoryl diester phosphodiesterase
MLIIGHRGAPSLAPENTIKSFQIALDNNVDGIELDVQLTKDNQLVVMHDLHTYKLNKKYNLINNYTFQEIQKMNPTASNLEQVLKIIPPSIEIHIEIKSNQINNKIIITKIYNLIIKYNLAQQTIISSFNPFVLSMFKKLNYSIRLGLLWTLCPNEPWFITHYSYYTIKPYSFHASIHYITPEIANWAKNKNMKLYYYTVNSPSNLNKAQSLYADGIFSDYPSILK